jgi:GNAT superfamily N-acetyltransferase
MTHQTDMLEAALPSQAQLRSSAHRSAALQAGRQALGKLNRWSHATQQKLARLWVPIRHLSERHRGRVLQHLLALNSDDRLLRFGQLASDEQIGRYVASMDFERDEIFGIFGRSLRIVAVAHLALADGLHQGELGVSVLPQARGRGLGGHLFGRATVQARNRGARTLVIHLARHNTAMLAIVKRAGAAVVFSGPDAIATLPLHSATWATQVGAALDQQAAEVDFQLKLQVHRLDRWLPTA